MSSPGKNNFVILIQAWQPDPRKDKSPLEQTIAYMEKNFSANLSLAELARRTKMSRNQFIYKFRGKMGTTPCQYLIDLRLKHACVLLEKQEMSTEEIAFACGFCDGNYLRKIYRRRFGTPVNRQSKGAPFIKRTSVYQFVLYNTLSSGIIKREKQKN